VRVATAARLATTAGSDELVDARPALGRTRGRSRTLARISTFRSLPALTALPPSMPPPVSVAAPPSTEPPVAGSAV
jgi:hypothetical protein